jgi:hypothetical protein
LLYTRDFNPIVTKSMLDGASGTAPYGAPAQG